MCGTTTNKKSPDMNTSMITSTTEEDITAHTG